MALALDNLYFPLILDVLDQGVFTVDENSQITSFNRAAEQITGFSSGEVIGVPCADVFRTEQCHGVCPLRQSIQSGSPTRNRQVNIRAKDGRAVPISLSTAPLVTRGGRLLGGVEVFRDMSQIADLKRRLCGRYRLADIVGKSPLMQQIFDLLPLVAASDATALISGPSGTGKELIARTIHSLGPRRKGPFVAINCAAIPETLLESELFGHVKGAFTDARQTRPGRIAAAEVGTLLLDEIGDLPRPMQVKVLRFLQDREYSPVGSDRMVRANVRVIAATNRELMAMVRDGHFREDLYFRLNVVQIDIPPLARRTEDIPLLVDHYIKVFRESTGKAIDGIDDDAMALLVAYSFPGNVRELENIVERGFILCQGAKLTRAHMPPHVIAAVEPTQERGAGSRGGPPMEAAIRLALEQSGGNRTRAAAQLGIHRITLLRRMQKLGIG